MSDSDDNDFDSDDDGGFLEPILADIDTTPANSTLPSLPDHPTVESLMPFIMGKVPLNRKQRLVVEKVLSAALSWKDHPYGSSERKQMLLHLSSAGVGKSQVVKGVVAGMDLLGRKDELIIMAPTGIAADKIGGSTYHTALQGIPINTHKEKQSLPPRINRLWSGETIMILDEISMVDLQHLYLINRHCNLARSVNTDLT